MFLLITGASGAGKSTIRATIASQLTPGVSCVELMDIVGRPAVVDIAWRQRSTEAVVRHALTLQQQGVHTLLASDPVAAGEVLASPSATALDGIAVLLLDIQPEAQSQRLLRRGEDRANLPLHHGFAAWMRHHQRDPQHMQHVLTGQAWEDMCWERWTGWHAGDPRWSFSELDITSLSKPEAAARVLDWVRRAIARDGVPVLEPGWAVSSGRE